MEGSWQKRRIETAYKVQTAKYRPELAVQGQEALRDGRRPTVSQVEALGYYDESDMVIRLLSKWVFYTPQEFVYNEFCLVALGRIAEECGPSTAINSALWSLVMPLSDMSISDRLAKRLAKIFISTGRSIMDAQVDQLLAQCKYEYLLMFKDEGIEGRLLELGPDEAEALALALSKQESLCGVTWTDWVIKQFTKSDSPSINVCKCMSLLSQESDEIRDALSEYFYSLPPGAMGVKKEFLKDGTRIEHKHKYLYRACAKHGYFDIIETLVDSMCSFDQQSQNELMEALLAGDTLNRMARKRQEVKYG